MIVLVAAGATSLPRVFSIAAVVFAEKIFPHGVWDHISVTDGRV